MSTGLIIGILILLLVVGVPILQAIIRGVQRRRSLAAEGVPSLRAAGLRREDLPQGLARQPAEAVTSEELALADDNPQATITQLGRLRPGDWLSRELPATRGRGVSSSTGC